MVNLSIEILENAKKGKGGTYVFRSKPPIIHYKSYIYEVLQYSIKINTKNGENFDFSWRIDEKDGNNHNIDLLIDNKGDDFNNPIRCVLYKDEEIILFNENINYGTIFFEVANKKSEKTSVIFYNFVTDDKETLSSYISTNDEQLIFFLNINEKINREGKNQ